MQLRFECHLTGEEYVNQQAWWDATLARCPLHPHGGCSFARQGTYERVNPPGTRIPRWYCPEGHCTFSLLADCFAARLTGTLHEIEAVVKQVEKAPTLEAAADRLRRDIELPGAIRWARRRVKSVYASLTVILGLFPELLAGCPPTLAACQWLQVDGVLPALRDIAAAHLAILLPPLGFRYALRERALLLFLYNTGARVQEVAELRWRNLELDHHRVYLRGKGDKWRACPLWDETVSLLRQLLDEPPPASPEQPVFISQRGQTLTRFGIYKIVRRHTAPLAKRGSDGEPITIHLAGSNVVQSAGVDGTSKTWKVC